MSSIEQSLEELREQIDQIQADLGREIREGHERFQVQIQEQVKAQISLVSKEIEDGMGRLEATLERFFKFQVGKKPVIETGLLNNTDKGIVDPLLLQVSSVKPNAIKGIEVNFTNEIRESHGAPVMNVVNEEIGGMNQYHGEQGYRGYLPESPFPAFDGTNPTNWVWKCELYFDLYQIPEVHKTLLAVFHFSDTAIAWYQGVEVNNEHLPWAVLKEKVMERFRKWGDMDPWEEFKQLDQIGSVEEYIENFERAKARLLCANPCFSEPFFVTAFICGLKEEIKYMVKMLKPSTLVDAFHRAICYEMHAKINLEEE